MPITSQDGRLIHIPLNSQLSTPSLPGFLLTDYLAAKLALSAIALCCTLICRKRDAKLEPAGAELGKRFYISRGSLGLGGGGGGC